MGGRAVRFSSLSSPFLLLKESSVAWFVKGSSRAPCLISLSATVFSGKLLALVELKQGDGEGKKREISLFVISHLEAN